MPANALRKPLPYALLKDLDIQMTLQTIPVFPTHDSIRPATPRPTHRLETLLAQSQLVKSIDAHHVQVRVVSGDIKANNNNQIRQHKDAAFEVVALEDA